MTNMTCPWCDGPVAVEVDSSTFDCVECAVIVEFAPDPRTELATAA